MSNLSAHKFKQVYEDLGYDLSMLGCIMLGVEPIDVIGSTIQEEMFYDARDPKRFWIKGPVGSREGHVTLLYGLLRSGLEMKKHVDAVLEGVDISTVEVDHVGIFESPYPDEAYDCIVAHLKITPELEEANERLKFLPHINTFPGYKAHVTLAYVQQGCGEQYAKMLNGSLAGKKLKTTVIDYGGNK